MLALYGNTWDLQYGRAPEGISRETWAAALGGITGPQIAEGLRACVAEGRDFPPSAPRFRAMCLGIPTCEAVAHAITSAAQKPPFARLVWQYLDVYRFRRADTTTAMKLLRDAYELAREYVMRGGALPAPGAEIEHRPAPRKPGNPEVALAALAQISEIVGLKDGAEQADSAETPSQTGESNNEP